MWSYLLFLLQYSSVPFLLPLYSHLLFSIFSFFCNIRYIFFFFFSSRRRHTRLVSDWSSDVCSSDLEGHAFAPALKRPLRRMIDRVKRDRHQSTDRGRIDEQPGSLLSEIRKKGFGGEIGRASCREKCRSRWSPYH